MAYRLSDLMDKFISIEENGFTMFSRLAVRDDIPLKIKTLARVFAKEEERHIVLYRILKDEITKNLDAEIDHNLFSKAGKLIDDLKAVNTDKIKDVNQLLEFSLNFERENLIMILEIRNISNEVQGLADILGEIASEEGRHVSNLEGYIR